MTVRRLRTEVNLTQDELTHLAGISLTSLARIETGKHGARLETVLNVAQATKKSGAELVAPCEQILKLAS